MAEIHSILPLPDIPDNLTIPQFYLDSKHHLSPKRPANSPWLIEDETGRGVYYEEVLERSHSLSNALSIKYKFGDNDVALLFSPNHVDYPISVWAVHRLGGVVSPANPAFTSDELVYQLETTKARLLFVHSQSLPAALTAAKQVGISLDNIIILQGYGTPVSNGHVSIGDLVKFGASKPRQYVECKLRSGEARTRLAFLSFSSGTTGRPKAVAIPHFAVIANTLQMAVHWRVGQPNAPNRRMLPGDVSSAVLPLFHIYGLVVTLHLTLFAGLSVVIIPRFNFEEFLKSIVRHRITHLFLVPPQVVLLCKHPAAKKYDLTHTKYIMCGAAPLSGELLLQISQLLPDVSIGQGYGLTETCTSVSILNPDIKVAKVGSAGQLLPGITARIVKSDGALASPGEQGELVVKGPSNALRYLNNDQATKETFVDGWVRTGDEVIMKDGEIYIVDRLKEIMKVRGFQVAPAELEGHLLLHPTVADACIVGVADEYSGELPYAFIVLAEQAAAKVKADSSGKEAELAKAIIKKHVSDAKVQYKWLEGGIEFVAAIPKTPSGKILRRLLRDQAKGKNAPAPVRSKL